MAGAIPTREQWFGMIQGRPPSADLDRCTALVFAYHLKGERDFDERIRIADEILGIAHGHLRTNGVKGASSDVIGLLGLSAEKDRLSLRASRGWSIARKVFAPAGSLHGPTRSVQHHHAGDARPTSVGNYWLEAVDPSHRSWGHTDPGIFNDWLNSSTKLSFWDWLEANGRANGPGVVYLAPDKRWQYQIFIAQDRRLYRHGPAARNAADEPRRFTTLPMSTLRGGAGFAIWVCGPDGTFYSDSHVESHFHHSSFLAGGRVLGAGEWVVSDGLIQLMNYKTGHYRATPKNLLNALRLLKCKTDLSHTVVAMSDYSQRPATYVKALDFIQARGDASLCPAIAAASAGGAIRAAVGNYASYVFVR